jgi:hypothetical protein
MTEQADVEGHAWRLFADLSNKFSEIEKIGGLDVVFGGLRCLGD